MSIKGFLEVQEMQEGGPAMFTPFAVDPEGSPRRRIAPTYQPNPPPTIVLDPIAPITPTPTPEQLNISPDPNYMGSIDMTLAQAGADRDGLGPISPHWSQEFLSTLESRGRPETDLSRATDKFALGVVAPVVAATLGTAFPPVGIAAAAMARSGVIGGKDGIISTIFGGGKPTSTTTSTNLGTTQFQTQTAPQAITSAIPQTPAQQSAAAIPPANYGKFSQNPAAPTVSESVSLDYATPTSTSQITPIASEFGPMGGGYLTPGSETVNTFSGTTGMSAAQVGSGMFGAAYGLGGEISPSFAIGGKGSFTSFAHYGAGVSQADEISIVSNAAPGVFASVESGKTAIDAMVANDYTEAQITEASKSTQDLQGQDFMNYQGADGGGGDGGISVICQELYDQGLLDQHTYSIEQKFGEYIRINDPALLEGYHSWACSVVNAMRKSKTITHVIRIIAYPVIKHIAYKMGRPSKTILGAVMFNVGAFVCRRLAKKETVYA